jgi:hypothetical protein
MALLPDSHVDAHAMVPVRCLFISFRESDALDKQVIGVPGDVASTTQRAHCRRHS